MSEPTAKELRKARRAAQTANRPQAAVHEQASVKKNETKPGPTSMKDRKSTKPQPQQNNTSTTEQALSVAIAPRRISLFSHLEQTKRKTNATPPKEVHPAVLSLALQYSKGLIIGSNARCIAMLNAFKVCIADYVTPHGTTLSRHLMTHINAQISYLISARPLSISMGTAIRSLKVFISVLGIDLSDDEAKNSIYESIDTFVRERIIMAGKVISASAIEQIQDGDVILVYAHSSIVQSILLAAHEIGKSFKVIVVDSRPKFEGRSMARVIAQAGLQVQYIMLTALGYVVETVTKTILGAHAVLSNGALYSRAGTALVAMACYDRDVPVIVACESYKFSDRVQLDSFVHNELADTAEMSLPSNVKAGMTSTTSLSPEKTNVKDSKKPVHSVANESNKHTSLDRETSSMKLNLMYDVTPSKFIGLCISEIGLLPSSAVPAALRESTIA